MFDLTPRPEYFSAEHQAFRATVKRFVDAHIAPHVNAWDEAGTFPRELYRQAAEVGIIGIGYPEALGGTPADVFFGIPFILVALGADSLRRRLAWFARHEAAVSVVTGSMLVVVGFLMITNLLVRLSQFFPTITI